MQMCVNVMDTAIKLQLMDVEEDWDVYDYLFSTIDVSVYCDRKLHWVYVLQEK